MADSGSTPQARNAATVKAVLQAMGTVSRGAGTLESIASHVLDEFDAQRRAEVDASGNSALIQLGQDAHHDIKNIPPHIHERAVLLVLQAILHSWNEHFEKHEGFIQDKMQAAAIAAADIGVWLKADDVHDPSLNQNYRVVNVSGVEQANAHYILGAGIVPLPPLGSEAPAVVASSVRPQAPPEVKNDGLVPPHPALTIPASKRVTRDAALLPLRKDTSSSSTPSVSFGPGVGAYDGNAVVNVALPFDDREEGSDSDTPPPPIDEGSDSDTPVPPPKDIPLAVLAQYPPRKAPPLKPSRV